MLKSALEKVNALRVQVEYAQAEADSEVVTAFGAVESLLRDYHARAEKLHLVPFAAKNAHGRQFTLTVSRNMAVTSGDEMLSMDVKKFVWPVVAKLKEEFMTAVLDLQDKNLVVKEKIDEAEECTMLKKNEIESMEHRLAKLEETYHGERDAMADQYRAASGEALALEEDIQSARKRNEEKLRQSQKALESAHGDYRKARDTVLKEKDKVHECMWMVVEMLTNHKSHIQERVMAVRDHAVDSLHELEDNDESIAEFLKPFAEQRS